MIFFILLQKPDFHTFTEIEKPVTDISLEKPSTTSRASPIDLSEYSQFVSIRAMVNLKIILRNERKNINDRIKSHHGIFMIQQYQGKL